MTKNHIIYLLFILLITFPIYAESTRLKTTYPYNTYRVHLKNMSHCEAAVNVLSTFSFSNDEEKLAFIRSTEKEIKKSTNTPVCAEYYLKIGDFFNENRLFKESIEAYLISKSIVEHHDLKSKKIYADLCDIMGHMYYHFGDYRSAATYLTDWYTNKNKSDDFIYNSLNTLGLTYYHLGELDTAQYYYENAIEEAKKQNNITWVGIISGNLSPVVKGKGQHEEAMRLVEIDYKISLAEKNYESAALALLYKAAYILDQGSTEMVSEILEEAKDLFYKDKTPPDFPDMYFKAKGDLNFLLGNYKEALINMQKAQEIRDSIAITRNETQLQSYEYQVYASVKEAEIQSLIYQKKKRTFYLWIISIISLVFIVALLLLIKQINSKRKKDREIQSIKNQLLNNKLSNAEENINQLLKNIKSRNAFIQKLSIELERAKKNNQLDPKSELRIAKTLKERKILTEEDWIRFKNLFEEIHPQFFHSLIEKFPSLTPAEMRMAALLKLNRTHLEMSTTLGISKESVRKTILRLRNKMEITSTDQLIQLIISL